MKKALITLARYHSIYFLIEIYSTLEKSFLIILLFFLVGKIDLGSVRLNFWDLGGQEELQSLWDKVSKQCLAFSTKFSMTL